MSQPPTPTPFPSEPAGEHVPSDGDRARAQKAAATLGLSGAQREWLARQFAAARFEELSAGDPRDLPLEPLPLEAQQAVALIRRVAATLRRPGELETALLPTGAEPIRHRVTSLAELEHWLGGLAERVLYGGIEQLAEDQ